MLFFFKQKAAYEMRISDWSSDVCSSDLDGGGHHEAMRHRAVAERHRAEQDRQRKSGLMEDRAFENPPGRGEHAQQHGRAEAMRHAHARQSDREAIDPAVEQMLAKADRHGACYISEAGESYNLSSRAYCDRTGEIFGRPLSPTELDNLLVGERLVWNS